MDNNNLYVGYILTNDAFNSKKSMMNPEARIELAEINKKMDENIIIHQPEKNAYGAITNKEVPTDSLTCPKYNSLSGSNCIADEEQGCYDSDNIGTIGDASWDDGVCGGKLIVDKAMLVSAITGDQEKYSIIHDDGTKYSFGKADIDDSGNTMPTIFTGQVTNMYGLFADKTNFNQDISHWDVGKVITMGFMFRDAHAFNQDISGWNVNKVKYTLHMFQRARVFDQDLSGWTFDNLENARIMFSGAREFNQDLSSWDMSQVTNVYSMFNGASKFDQDLSGWCVQNVLVHPDGRNKARYFADNSGMSSEDLPLFNNPEANAANCD
jgi:surface protein